MADRAATIPLAPATAATAPPAGGWRRAWLVGRRRPAAVVGAAIVVLFTVMALGAPWLAPSDPTRTDWSQIRKAPSLAPPFGTGERGPDGRPRVGRGPRTARRA